MLAAMRTTVLLLLLIGCGTDIPSTDAGPPDAGPADAGTPWPHARAPLGAETRREFQLARGIVHLHSPLSHDACDGRGWADGALADAACLAHLRDAACRLSMDVLFLTDHAPNVDTVSFEAALWMADGDEAIRNEDGATVAARWACPGTAHRVLVTVGSENRMMPVALERHPDVGAGTLEEAYDADGPDAAAAFRAAGALIFYAHTESKTLEQIRASRPDGIEIYNTHANVAPNIRQESLGLDAAGFAGTLLRFSQTGSRLEPDLSILTFLSPNRPSLRTWDTLLAEGMRLTGTGGCDAHENTFTQLMPDGERGDSFRRMMVWHAQHFLVAGTDRADYVEALARGRTYVAFEVFGTPMGFDFHADLGGEIAEMGGETAVGAVLRVTRPGLPAGFPSDPPPALSLHLLRAAEGGAVEVASGAGPTLEHVATLPGAYRVEVRMVPEHARPYLGRFADELVREVVWVYSNPIHVL